MHGMHNDGKTNKANGAINIVDDNDQQNRDLKSVDTVNG